MVENHMKRMSAPKSWVVQRKERMFITRPKPGRSFALAMPLNQVMKVLLTKGKTTKEVRYVLAHEEVLVNGKRIVDHRLPVGFMDIISFPSISEHYLISLSQKGKLTAVSITDKEAVARIVRISGKTRVAGKTQINCVDGTNLLVEKESYKVGDSIVLSKGKVSKHLPLKEGAAIMLTGGKHLSKTGTVKQIDADIIVFDTADGTFSTAKRHAYVVGEKSPEVTLR